MADPSTDLRRDTPALLRGCRLAPMFCSFLVAQGVVVPQQGPPRVAAGRAGPTAAGRSEDCLCAVRKGHVLVVWKLDRPGRNLTHLGLRVLAGQRAQVDTTTVLGIFAELPKLKRGAGRERTVAGPEAARVHGRQQEGGDA